MNPPEYILVIDDDLQIRKVLETVLRRSGLRVVCVASGEEGLRQIDAEPPVVVITDMSMPGLCGRKLCTGIADRKASHRFLTIVLSGIADFDGCTWVEQLEETVFVRKPFSPVALLKQVKEYLTSGALAQEPV